MSARVEVQDAVREFGEVLRQAGLMLDGSPEMDDRLHRVKVEGDSGRERSGAYVGHLDGWPAGYVQNFRAGIRRNWKYSKGGIELSARERRQLQAETKRRQEAREAERQQLHERTAKPPAYLSVQNSDDAIPQKLQEPETAGRFFSTETCRGSLYRPRRRLGPTARCPCRRGTTAIRC